MSSIASTSRGYGQPLKPLSDSIAIRSDHIALGETALRLYPKADKKSPADYTIKNITTGSTVFSVTGKKYGSNPGREFRDSTGLPLFELRRAGFFIRPWRVRLPGDNRIDLASIYMQGPSRRITLKLAQNQAAAADGVQRVDEEKTVTLKVFQTTALFTFDILAGDQKVAHIQENTEINGSAGHWISGPYHYVPPRLVLDIRLAEGLDASIAALIGVFISDMFFGDQLEA